MQYGFAIFPNTGVSHAAVEMHIAEKICGGKFSGKNLCIVAPGPTWIQQMELTLWHVFFPDIWKQIKSCQNISGNFLFKDKSGALRCRLKHKRAEMRSVQFSKAIIYNTYNGQED